MARLLQSLNLTFIETPSVLLLGVVHCIFMLFFLVLSIPVYVFRGLGIIFAKLFRSDLGDILSGQSAVLVNDYMAPHPPRSIAIQVMVFEGQLTLEELKRRILKSWIMKTSPFENFQRYPFKWMGFTFWKDASQTFSIENHLKKHSGSDTEVGEEQLVELCERLLNTKLPKCQSPWEMYLIENYKYPYSDKESQTNSEHHSVLILKFHHCLMDGTGMMTALMDGMFEQPWMRIRQLEGLRPKQTFCQKLLYNMTFPVKAFMEISYIFSHTFRKDPFKIPDEMKDWYHVVAKSAPIPIQVVKDIKNMVGVSYASVLLSAISAAVYKTLSSDSPQRRHKPTLCMSVLPPVGTVKRKVLANHMTGAVFDLPTVKFEDPIGRLRMVNRLLEDNRRSVIPLLGQYYTNVLGAHSYFFNRFLTKNRMIPIGLSNFVCVKENVKVTENLKWIDSCAFSGGHVGITGLSVVVMSHGQNASVMACAERGLMSRVQAEEFLSYFKEEISLLQNLTI